MKRLLFVLTLLIVLLGGCAEEVQKKNIIPEATEMTITIYFRGNVDTTIYKYYMIFSNTSGIRLPNISLSNPYFLRPGEPIDKPKMQTFIATDNINYYYDNFYYSWHDVIRYKIAQYTVVRGDSAQGTFPPTASETIHNNYTDSGTLFPARDSTSGTTLQLTFSVNGVQSYSKGNRLFFNFVAVDSGAHAGLLYDYLKSEPSIQCISGAEMNEYDTTDDSAKPAGADIIKWSVRIQ